MRAGPVGHLHAAAVVGRHGVQRLALDERLGHIGHEVGHHVRVAAHAAAGADHGLAGDLHVAVGVGGHKPGHGAVLHDNVLGGGAEVELGARLLGRGLVVHLDLRLVALAVEGADARPELDARELGELVGGRREEGRRHGGEVLFGQAVEVPVGVLLGVLGELHDE